MNNFKFIFLVMTVLLLHGCKKFLDEKPDKRMALPNSIPVIQGMLDNDVVMNLSPGTGEASADNYYVTDAVYAALSSNAIRNMYTWESDITLNEFPNHWSRLYDAVTIANLAIEGLDKIQPPANEEAAWSNAMGSAYFFRAKSFLTAAGYWAPAYNKSSAGTAAGIPLRLQSDFEPISTRATVLQSYEQVVRDLKQSVNYLPVSQKVLQRPSRGAALALLARTYLFMSEFDSALIYADKSLQLNSTLLNFNTISSSPAFPIPLYNVETLSFINMASPTIISNSRAIVDSNLYRSYQVNDLRLNLFFGTNANGVAFRGNYTQSSVLFSGIATDEVWLMKAECLARAGKTTEAMAALNTLLVTRWKTGTFVPLTAPDAGAALAIILTERRKELLFRDLRWMDLKRLNLETAFRKTITRRLNGITYTLNPNDNRYALPIPSSVIDISGMAQNPR